MAKNGISGELTLFNTDKGILSGTNLSAYQTAILVSNEAKSLSPSDTGLLRNSIMAVSYDGRSNGFNNDSGDKQATKRLTERPRNGSAHVGTATDYAIWMEFGTSHQDPQPYLRPAIDLIAKRKSTEEVIGKYFNDELVKSTKRKDKVIKIK